MEEQGPTNGVTSLAARRAGRVCEEEGCGTRLSIYNEGRHCALHAPMVVPRTRGRKAAS